MCSSSSSSGSGQAIEWKVWPGGHTDEDLNPTESFSSADFGFEGNVDWDVGQGEVEAEILEADGGTSIQNRASITVRYNNVSPSSDEEDTVWIEAEQDDEVEAKLRTVFKVAWKPQNFSTNLDDLNELSFQRNTGRSQRKCAFNWDGDDYAYDVAGKTEAILEFEPAGIDWPKRGIHWEYSQDRNSPKFGFRLERKMIYTDVMQQDDEDNRTLSWNSEDWEYDHGVERKGGSDKEDTQYPNEAEPDKAFRIDCPGFPRDTMMQTSMRVDFRNLAEWCDGTTWSRISPWENAEWFFNATGEPPSCSKGTPNNHGAGLLAAPISNAQPVANAGDDQAVAGQAMVTLDGSGSSDEDSDVLTYQWTQTQGTAVTLSDDTAEKPTFTAPAGPDTLVFSLKVSDITKELHHHETENYESDPDTVTITVSE